MKLGIYCLRDDCAERFADPFTANNDNVALRNMVFAFRRPDMKPYAKDFALYQVGEFNVETGEVTPITARLLRRDFTEREEVTNDA